MIQSREGGCQCGAVRYRITGAPLTLYACHCTECQKQSASAFGLSLWVRAADFTLLSGKPKVWSRPTDSGGTMDCSFCPDCGSRLHHCASDEPAVLSVKAGSLDDTKGLNPAGHIWTRSAQPWVSLGGVAPELVCATEPENFDAFLTATESLPSNRDPH